MERATASELELSFARDLPLTRDAIVFAQDRHGEQRRGGDGAPYLLHVLEVASLLERSSLPDHVIAAAVLHDVLEDTDAQRAELELRFGYAVSELVVLVTDDPSVNDEEQRKDQVRERVRRAGGDALAVYASDKVSKVRELRMSIVTGLPDGDAESKRRRHWRSLEMLEQEAAGARIVELLRFELEALDQLPPDPSSAGTQP